LRGETSSSSEVESADERGERESESLDSGDEEGEDAMVVILGKFGARRAAAGGAGSAAGWGVAQWCKNFHLEDVGELGCAEGEIKPSPSSPWGGRSMTPAEKRLTCNSLLR
jgi:hypothetical protein